MPPTTQKIIADTSNLNRRADVYIPSQYENIAFGQNRNSRSRINHKKERQQFAVPRDNFYLRRWKNTYRPRLLQDDAVRKHQGIRHNKLPREFEEQQKY